MFKGFRDFILRGNVMDLAVAVIIGAAFTAIVTALTADIINPLLGAFIGKPDFDYLVADVHGGEVLYGTFITAIVNFLILAGGRLLLPRRCRRSICSRSSIRRPRGVPTTKACPQCLGDIPIAATRCKFCTQPVISPTVVSLTKWPDND